METIYWIIIFGMLMSCIALAGSLLLFLKPSTLNKIMLPLISFAAGSLMGGAVFHMIPHAVEAMGNTTTLYVWLMAGFTLFLGLEQFLNWHHSHTHGHTCGPLSPPHQHSPCPPIRNDDASSNLAQVSRTHVTGLDCAVIELERTSTTNILAKEEEGLVGVGDNQRCSMWDAPTENRNTGKASGQSNRHVTSVHGAPPNTAAGGQPLSGLADATPTINGETRSFGYLMLIADTVHNFLGGLFVGASFVDSTELGLSAWVAAAAHEVPQEIGDFAVLVHCGWSQYRALLYNFLSSLTFPLGMLLAYASSESMDVSFLIPFAAGNFLYIAATDLIPEVKHFHGIKTNAINYAAFLLGVGLLLAVRVVVEGW